MPVSCVQYEVAVVDTDLPMEYYRDNEEYYTILARNRAHAELATTLVCGDNYGISRVLAERDRDIETPADEFDTDLTGMRDCPVNAFEVTNNATFWARFFDTAREDQYRETFDSLVAAVRWYLTHDASAHFAEEWDSRTTPSYEGHSQVVEYDTYVRGLSASQVHEFVAAVSDLAATR